LVLSGIFEGGVRCAFSQGKLCAFAERSADGKQIIFTSLDPLKGRGHELARFGISPENTYGWALSPDGTLIAVVKYLGSEISILPLAGEAHRISVKGWTLSGTPWWTADGKGLIVSSSTKRGAVLLHIDLEGNANVLWERAGSPGTFAVPSPDGRNLAMMAWDVNSNVWMMDNF
jgi:Tol biopolymer transport system component